MNGKEKKDMLVDGFGRSVTYLRVSVTDRCNHRCAYCVPHSGDWKKRGEIMSFDDITRVASLMAGMGLKKIRLTGGEPLVRKDVDSLVGMLANIPGIEDLTLTTNAALLSGMAQRLKDKGLRRINVSLDTVNPDTFRKLCGAELAPVLSGIDAALAAGLTPVRINTVLMRGVNEEELASIMDFAAARKGLTLRFIELMPMSEGFDWKAHYLSVDEVLARPDVKERVDTSAAPKKAKAAAYFLPLKSGSGDAGFISPMSNRFCSDCNRLRLTADGRLRSCLPADKDIDIKASLARNASDEELRALIMQAVLLKPEMGVYNFEDSGRDRSMIQIGG